MNNMLLALQITALGMGLVFGAIILLWLMMTLLTAFTADKDASTSDSCKLDPDMDNESKTRAAALAVAIALAEQQASSARPLSQPPTAIVSAWTLGMRTRQMVHKDNR
jgi:Na+-transporting methylmalonyl-CoA/oxaloacetate decarboxylase gamma subunit